MEVGAQHCVKDMESDTSIRAGSVHRDSAVDTEVDL